MTGQGQIDLWCILIRFNISYKHYDFRLNSYKKMNRLRFFHYECIRNQIGPCRKKKVKVNPDSSFVQTWKGPHPQCYIPSPKAIGLLVPEKDIFKRFLPF